jgi:cytochrome c
VKTWNHWRPALLTWALMQAIPMARADGPDPGTRAWLQCRACHSLKAGEPDKVGPNLHGLVGAKAGTLRPGYAYSAALKASGIVWDVAQLERWITDPAMMVPGTRMAYAGLPDSERRRALIAYLERETRPEAAP